MASALNSTLDPGIAFPARPASFTAIKMTASSPSFFKSWLARLSRSRWDIPIRNCTPSRIATTYISKQRTAGKIQECFESLSMSGKTKIRVKSRPFVLSLVKELCVIRFSLFFVAFALSPCISPAQTVRISYAGLSGYNVPLWVSQEAGLFKKYGLPAELVLIDGGSTNIQVLLANEARFVNVAGSAPILARVHGAKVVIIAASYNFIPYSLLVNKDIRSVADLKGKRMAITRLGGVTEVAASLALQKL